MDIYQRLLYYQVDALVLRVLDITAKLLVGLQLLPSEVFTQKGHRISFPTHRPWMGTLNAVKSRGQPLLGEGQTRGKTSSLA